MTNKSNNVKRESTIDDIINEIKQKSNDGDYIYRGERRRHPGELKNHLKVSSALYRDYAKIDFEGFDLRLAQKQILKIAKKHIGQSSEDLFDNLPDVSNVERSMLEITIREANQRAIVRAEEAAELEILTELQHYGGKTNLIDFTTDYLIATFFACAGRPKEDGRVILLKKNKEIEAMIIRPVNPRHRVIAQKSVFLHPPQGFIEVHDDDSVIIPFNLKEQFLKYLRKFHDISAETIYNDIHGFIINQNIQQNAYIELYTALTYHHRALEAKTDTERKDAYKNAIAHYDTSIELNPELDFAYGNRGECWLHFEEWKKAAEDFTIAQDMGSDIAASFHNDYKGGIEEFEEKTGIKLPRSIAVLLGY